MWDRANIQTPNRARPSKDVSLGVVGVENPDPDGVGQCDRSGQRPPAPSIAAFGLVRVQLAGWLKGSDFAENLMSCRLATVLQMSRHDTSSAAVTASVMSRTETPSRRGPVR